MKIAVAFHSGYGHTAKQAAAVAEGVKEGGAEALLVDVGKDVPWDALKAADGIIFGSPTYMGSVSGEFKKFMDASSKPWATQDWKDKLAAGFTNSASQSGDKLNTLTTMAVFAAQHGMIWVSLGLMPGNNSSKGSIGDLNRLGGFMGAMAQSNADQPADLVPPASDLATARHLGTRVATLAAQLAKGRG